MAKQERDGYNPIPEGGIPPPPKVPPPAPIDKNGGPAFPHWDGPGGRCFNGMTLWDYFAGSALAGILSDPACNASDSDIARSAYNYANAMIAEREKRSGRIE